MIRHAVILFLSLLFTVHAGAETWEYTGALPAEWTAVSGAVTSSDINLRFRSLTVPSTPGKSKEWIAVEIIDSISRDTCRIELRAELGTGFDDRAGYCLTCGKEIIRYNELRRQRLFNRENCLQIDIADNSSADIRLDRHPPRRIATALKRWNKIRITAFPDITADVSIDSEISAADDESMTVDRIRQLVGKQPVSGFFSYLDRENDPRMAEPGGFYTLAIVPETDGSFRIIYVSGAKVNSQRWKTGMTKGRLIPTEFTGHYDMQWIDSDGIPMTSELSASFLSADGILELNFPLYNTRMRYRKLP